MDREHGPSSGGVAAWGSSGGGAGPGARIDAGRDSSGSGSAAHSPDGQGAWSVRRRRSGAGPGARIDVGRGSSGGITKGYKFDSEKANALNTYAAMKSDGSQGAPPPAATSTASPIPGVHISTLEYKFVSEKASALNTYAVMKFGSKWDTTEILEAVKMTA